MLKGHYPELYYLANNRTSKVRDEPHPLLKHKIKALQKNKEVFTYVEALFEYKHLEECY
jgi:hypothetical protein